MKSGKNINIDKRNVLMNTDEKGEYQNETIDELDEMAKSVGRALKKNYEDLSRAHELMEFLEIPVASVGLVSIIKLYDILMDEEKLKVLISKLHNKVFW